jgi:hypothetical protein
MDSDKLPAISGLASYFHKSTGCFYAAGLWKEDISSGCLWERETSVSLKYPQYCRAPSWSWACREGKIRFQRRILGQRSLISDISVELNQFGIDRFGALNSYTLSHRPSWTDPMGILTVTGHLINVQPVESEPSTRDSVWGSPISNENGLPVGLARFDELDFAPAADSVIFVC